MVNFVYCLTNLLFFDIPLRYYYINLRSSIICCLFSVSFSTISKLFCGELYETFVILSAILSAIKSPVVSAVFLIALLEAVLSVSAAECSGCSRSF